MLMWTRGCPQGENIKTSSGRDVEESQPESDSEWVNKRHLSIITRATGVLHSHTQGERQRHRERERAEMADTCCSLLC